MPFVVEGVPGEATRLQLAQVIKLISPYVSPAAGLVLTGVVAFFAWEVENSQAQQLWQLRAECLGASVDTSLTTSLRVLADVAAPLQSSADVLAENFSRNAALQLAARAQISSVKWVPLVHDSQRREFERRARERGLVDFTITERAGSHEEAPAVKHTEYFPVLRSQTSPGVVPDTRTRPGFDTASIPTMQAAIAHARSTMRPAADVLFPASREGLDRDAQVWVFVPMSGASVGEAESPSTKDQLRGFAVAVLGVGRAAENALGPLDVNQNPIRIDDVTDPTQVLTVYRSPHPSHLRYGPVKGTQRMGEAQFEFGGRVWRLRVHGLSDANWFAADSIVSWVALVSIEVTFLLFGFHWRASVTTLG